MKILEKSQAVEQLKQKLQLDKKILDLTYDTASKWMLTRHDQRKFLAFIISFLLN